MHNFLLDLLQGSSTPPDNHQNSYSINVGNGLNAHNCVAGVLPPHVDQGHRVPQVRY